MEEKPFIKKLELTAVFFFSVSYLGECVLSAGFVYTLKCTSLVLVLCVYMATVGPELLS